MVTTSSELLSGCSTSQFWKPGRSPCSSATIRVTQRDPPSPPPFTFCQVPCGFCKPAPSPSFEPGHSCAPGDGWPSGSCLASPAAPADPPSAAQRGRQSRELFRQPRPRAARCVTSCLPPDAGPGVHPHSRWVCHRLSSLLGTLPGCGAAAVRVSSRCSCVIHTCSLTGGGLAHRVSTGLTLRSQAARLWQTGSALCFNPPLAALTFRQVGRPGGR